MEAWTSSAKRIHFFRAINTKFSRYLGLHQQFSGLRTLQDICFQGYQISGGTGSTRSDALPTPILLDHRWKPSLATLRKVKSARASRTRASRMAAAAAARAPFHLQFITTPTSDTNGTAIALHFDNKKYIFGSITEGTQRVITQRGIPLKKVRNIFLTGQVDWNTTGGLIGLILTISDIHGTGKADREKNASTRLKKSISEGRGEQLTGLTPNGNVGAANGTLTIHGGEKLLYSLACARKFTFRQGMPLEVNEFESDGTQHPKEPTWEDENVRVWAMAIPSSEKQSLRSDSTILRDISTEMPSPNGVRRKRTLDQYQQEANECHNSEPLDQHREAQKVRQEIITAMFNSTWNRDALSEVPLKDVNMPADLFVRDPQNKKIIRYIGPKPGEGFELPDVTVLVRDPWPTARFDSMPPLSGSGSDDAMSYIIQGYPQRGRFDSRKAVALGVPKGQSYSVLTAGKPVVLENGTTVTPEMVIGPSKPGRSVGIVHIPTLDHVVGLTSRPEWRDPLIMDELQAICWMLGPGVASHEVLVKFIASLPDVKHVISSPDTCPNNLSFDSSAASAIRLSLISDRHFVAPIHDNTKVPQVGLAKDLKILDLPNVTVAVRGLKIMVQPNFQIEKKDVPPLLNVQEVIESLPPVVRQLAQEAQQQLAAERNTEMNKTSPDKGNNFDPEIITLGTGSAQPSKYRNVSATLLRTEKYGNFLFDCGENTLGQLRRIFDPPALRDVLRNLKLIWLSHNHADHHLGTVSVLKAVRSAFSEIAQKAQTPKDDSMAYTPVAVASDHTLLSFLREYASVESLPEIFPISDYTKTVPATVSADPQQRTFYEANGILSLFTVFVDHCASSQAIVITFKNGFRFSYSGDCRPSASFAKAGEGSDVLVHEATFDDEMSGDALAKKHCTTAEALGIAAKMKAKNVILTHFSQRYQKLPNMGNMVAPSTSGVPIQTEAKSALNGAVMDGGAIFHSQDTPVDGTAFPRSGSLGHLVGLPIEQEMHICAAFDLMRVRVSEIKDMRKLTPALSALLGPES